MPGHLKKQQKKTRQSSQECATTQILPPEGRTLPTEGGSQWEADALSGR